MPEHRQALSVLSPSAAFARAGALVIVGAALLTLSAKTHAPFYPVPMTFQTFAVLTLGAAYGAKLGAATVMFYLATGALGLPVFADSPEKGIGIAYILGPTGGYLVGFVFAAALAGWLFERGGGRNAVVAIAAMLAATVAIYVPGLLWLGAAVGWDKPVLKWGLAPFVYGDALKILLAAFAAPAAAKAVRRFHPPRER